MRRFNLAAIAAFTAIALAAGAAAQTPPPKAPQVIPNPPVMHGDPVVPYPSPSATPAYTTGVNINVALTEPVTSQTAHVGDTFSYNTTEEAKLGPIDVPAGTPGKGRLAVVVPAQGDNNGQLTLQADEIDLADGRIVWVNIDTTVPPHGHYSKNTTKTNVYPLVVVISKKSQGDLVLDVGTAFRVTTIPPRKGPAALLTAPPVAAPEASPASVPAAGPAMTPAAMGTPLPAPVPKAT